MIQTIKIRAHHLLCIPRFYRGGYDEEFALNMKNICMHIRNHPDAKIKVVVGELDDLCKPCPHKHNNDCIQSKKIGKWVISQDKKVAKFLKIKPNSIHKAKDIFNLALEKVNNTNISFVCKDCIFLSNCIDVGINNSFKKDLNKK
ncbi:DUF1284 domain-containing protein [Candidatus Woesearchaeota archaeon]|jgi:uncharacterized protein|nr:DUF1284 domain-containing protein [Candidatus Woesearchaeota archaeon]MBT6520078.1 DUF1284 domain-containing protein [Candidatus Woesearchaeota archaeon]MBT7366683.1 DUF1284 domain-containing protein [Candidatus Woesearchaeota archaeon]